jgi:transcriptional regulator with XRE-family HTH domain
MDGVGKRIQESRNAKGWSLQQLADRLTRSGKHVNRQWVHKKERGDSKVTILELLQFAAVLGVSPIRLLGGDNDTIVLTDSPSITTTITHAELRKWFAGVIQAPFPLFSL